MLRGFARLRDADEVWHVPHISASDMSGVLGTSDMSGVSDMPANPDTRYVLRCARARYPLVLRQDCRTADR